MKTQTSIKQLGTQPEELRVFENGRLVYYRQEPNPEFWDQVWEKQLKNFSYADYQEGQLGWIEPAVKRWLPKEGKTLEAGCGMGHYVLALLKSGYDAEGIEYAPKTVAAVRVKRPDIPIREGDVTQINVPDKYYKGYVSLGVVEHRKDGPEPFIREAHRVLADDGIIIISVPYFNSIRQIKSKLGLYNGSAGDLSFYQYAISKDEFAGLLTRSGFEIIDTYGYDGAKCLKDEFRLIKPLINWLLGIRLIGRILKRTLKFSCMGHMILFVAKKNSNDIC